MVTSQLPVEHWHETIGDPTIADAILDRLKAGTMPCDGAWPKAQVDLFDRWVTGGKAP